MKKALFSIVIFAILASGCKKSSAPDTNIIYKGVIINSVCLHSVIQTIGPNYLGENGWTGSTGAQPLDHVFSVQNYCQFEEHNIGDTVNFKIIPAQAQNCMYCMMVIAAPSTSYSIEIAP
jgi:hypothetical protein